MLAVVGTRTVQYHAPVYRALQTRFGVPVTAIYGSDFSVAGYRDREFGADFAWDTDLLSGYAQVFLSRVSEGDARAFEEVSARGLGKALRGIAPKAVLALGYSTRVNQVAFYEAWRNKCPILFRGRRQIITEVGSRSRPWRGTASCVGVTSARPSCFT